MMLLAGILVMGCGEARTSVRGKVTCNGEPLAHGHIYFEPTDGSKGLDGGADIVDGAYQIRSITPGSRRVLIKSKPTSRSVRKWKKRCAEIQAIKDREKQQQSELERLRGQVQFLFCCVSCPSRDLTR